MPTPTTELAAGLAWVAALVVGTPDALTFHTKTFDRYGARVVVEQTAPDRLSVAVNGKNVLKHNIVGYVDNAWVVDLDRDGNLEVAFQEVNGKEHYATLHFFEWRDGVMTKVDVSQSANGDSGEFSIKAGRIFFSPGKFASNGEEVWIFRDDRIALIDQPKEQVAATTELGEK